MKKITNTLGLGILLLVSNLIYSQTARVQVIHNAADAAAEFVDVYLNGTLLLDNFKFRTATPFIDAPAGVPIQVDVAPSTSTSVAQSIYNINATLNDGSTYIVVANGIVSPTGYSPNKPFELSIFAQGRETASSGSNTDVLVHHGSTDAPTVDVVNTTSLPLTTLINNLSFPAFESGYASLPTADYTVDVTDQSGSTVVASYDVPLETLGLGGQAITVIASGFLNPLQNSNGAAFGLWVALPSGGNLVPLSQSQYARVQIIHNCADAAASSVDVYINGNLELDNFAFRNATPFLDLVAETPISIDIAPATSTSALESIYNLTTTLTTGAEYIIVANGIVSTTGYAPNQPFQLSVFDQARETASNASNTDLLIHHGSTDAPTVDVVETSVPAGTIVNDISYPNFAANYLELPAADYTLNVTDASGSTVVATYSAPLATLGLDGESLTVVASGFLDPSQNSNGPAFGLWVAESHGGALIPLPLVVPAPTARVQVIHNSADAAAEFVDVYLNGSLLLDNFEFRTATPFIAAPAGIPIQIDVAPSTSTSVAQSIYNIAPTLTQGETYIVVANGIVSPTGYAPSQAFELSVFAQGRETASAVGNTDILVNHGSTDAPTVDVVETSVPAGTIVNDISFPEFTSNYLELPTSNYTLDVTDATGTVVVATYAAPLQTLALQGQALTVLASGFLNSANNSNGPAFGLWVALASGGDLIPLPLVTPPAPTARVQVIHNSADAAAEFVDVYLNGSLLLDNFKFRTATPFIDAPAGTPIQIDVAPSTSTSVAQSIYNIAPTLTQGETYILVANGIVSPTGYAPSQPFELSVFAQGRETASGASNTDILVNHGSTDAPTVDVVETSIPAGTIVNDISFPNFTSNYLELPTADYTLDVTDATGTVVVATYAAPLETLGLQGQALTVLASGFLNPANNSNGPGFGLWVASTAGGDLIPLPLVTPPAPTARVQVIHNSADAAAEFVDVYLNGSLLLDNFKFRTATPFIDAPAGTPIQIDVAPSTSTSVAQSIYNIAPTLTQGETYIVVANGIVSPTGYTPSQAFELSVFAQGRETASGASNTDILVNHGSTDAPTVDVVETSIPAGTIVNDISFPEFTSNYLELPTADYTLNVTDATGTVVVATYAAPLQTLALQGQALTVLASGFLNPANNSNGPAFGLWVALASGGDLIPLPLVPLSTEIFSASTFSIYPNPASNELNVSIPFTFNTISGKVLDMSGRAILNLPTVVNKIDTSSLSNGMYVLDIKIDNKSYQQKFVVNKR